MLNHTVKEKDKQLTSLQSQMIHNDTRKTQYQHNPTISVIIPMYNDDKYISDCLDSLIAQTYTQFEAIIINDGSTDKSIEKAQMYVSRDKRFHLIHHANNKGTLLARKTGVLAAVGEYVCFLDADDKFASSALETMVKLMRQHEVDILQYRIDIFGNTTQTTRNSVLAFFDVKNITSLETSYSILNACFTTGQYGWNMCTKVFRLPLCKLAFTNIEDVHLVMAEDLYQYFLVAALSHSYLYIPTAPLYLYRLGAGISTQNFGLEQFSNFITGESSALRCVRNFLLKQQLLEKYQDIFSALYRRFINYNVNRFARLSLNDSAKGFSLLINCFQIEEVMGFLWNRFNNSQQQLIEKVSASSALVSNVSLIKTVGIFYYRYYHGGIERVISLQIPIFLKMGYKVILLTNEIAENKEYPLDKSVKRIRLTPSYTTSIRASVLADAIRKYNIDVVLYHACSNPNLLYDLLVIKGCGIPFIGQQHGLAVNNIWNHSPVFSRSPFLFKLADQLIVLNHMDEAYYRSFGVRARFLPNPVQFEVTTNSIIRDKSLVLWVGRLDCHQKNYMDALKIMNKALDRGINVHMVMIGAEYDKGSGEAIQQYILKNNLTNYVKWLGNVPDVSIWYQRAAIHLVTSSYETFPMNIFESKSFGVPLVTYEMPYIDMLRSNEGFISVPQRSIDAAVDAICLLLTDNALYTRLSKEAKHSI